MPLFSVLLPSKDRLDLLKLAVQSVLRQDFADFEIVISDNASSTPYEAYVASLRDSRIKCLRSDHALSVTENWNKSLQAATGDYVLMLGDDDALAPGLLAFLSDLIVRHEKPAVLYVMAYHYLYPEVFPATPLGSLSEVANSELFLRHTQPYFIASDEASTFAHKALNFQHMVSFNAQHFIWRRDFTQTASNFFQPPYPDYFACFYTFANAGRILIVPKPCIIIGIAKQSFGFFYINNRQDEGNLAFGDTGSSLVTDEDGDVAAALAFSGPVHYRNWLLTSLRYQTMIDSSVVIETDRYRRIQIVETMAEDLANDPAAALSERAGWSRFGEFVSQSWAALKSAACDTNQRGSLNGQKVQILQSIGVYFPAKIIDVPLGAHSDIMDAFQRLASVQLGELNAAPQKLLQQKSKIRTLIEAASKTLRRLH